MTTQKIDDTQAGQPTFLMMAQYVKDMSFENVLAPRILLGDARRPNLDININVRARLLQEDIHEVVLEIHCKAIDGSQADLPGKEEEVLFGVELVYGGAFKVSHFPEEQANSIVFVECPRLLFPFARQIIANATQSGGYPPLMIDPVDFLSLYRSRRVATENPNGNGEEAVN